MNVEGLVEDIVFRNEANGWTVIELKQERGGSVSCVGVMPFIASGERVLITGEWAEHRDYGKQIRVDSYESVRPTTKSGIERYLASGMIKGIGPATAKQIVDAFGVNALDILDGEPERLREIDGIGPKRMAMIIQSYSEQRQIRNTMVFLAGYGLSPALSLKVYKLFGDMSCQIVRADPYRLADEVQGIGFHRADAIAHSMGVTPEDEHRLSCGIRFALNEAVGNAGHVYLPVDTLLDAAKALLNVPEPLVRRALTQLILGRQVIAETVGDDEAIYLPKLYEAEQDIAFKLLLLSRAAKEDALNERTVNDGIERYEAEEGVTLCLEQRRAVLSAAQNGVTVITGGPGTGKTTGINCILRLLKRFGKIELCAPTGRAAKRMSEATGQYARTIHRLLEYSGEEESFKKDQDNPLNAKVVVVDEMSMVDVFLMRSLLRALKPGTRLVLVGDADQLPSVGAGNVLKDIIASEQLAVVRLTEIFRQAQESMIIVNAHRINQGENPIINKKQSDFFMERVYAAGEAAERVVALVRTRLPAFMGLDPVKDIQVMAPMKKGEAGVFRLNAILQSTLNPAMPGKAELTRGDTVFREGDKVMQIKNDYTLLWTRDGEEGDGVFNGDIGFVDEVDKAERVIKVRFDDGRLAEYDDSTFDELELAYCMSVHKSQGSEFDAVVMPLITGPSMLLTRNLLYTAVTRAKKLVVLVGRPECVARMVNNNHVSRRFSALNVRLKQCAGA